MKKIFIFSIVVLVVFILIYTYFKINGYSNYLKIELNGNNIIKLNYKDEYLDQGAKAFYKNKNITNDINIKTNINLEKTGEYFYTYKIKYKKQEKEIKRKIIIVDNEKPNITLNGKKEIELYKGSTYEELGAKAIDNYDNDITDKIKITGDIDTNKVGEYLINYSVADSSNNNSIETRKVKVLDNSNPAKKIAVLNYHFFYEKWDEGCHQVICEKMDDFRSQLSYLKENNFKTLTINEFIDWMYGKIELPEKSVLITIDDGGYGTGTHASNHLIKALEEYQVNATLFLITGFWDTSYYKSDYLDVESHSDSLHIDNLHNKSECKYRSQVNCVSKEEIIEDLKKSIEKTKTNNAFCFPFYEYTNKSLETVKELGFKVAFIGGNRKASRESDKYKIPRYVIHNETTLDEFKKMVN